MTLTAKLSKIRQIAITVKNIDVSISFYHDILGLDLSFRANENLAFLDADGIRIMLTIPQGAGAIGANSILYFLVQDIESSHKLFVERGATNERLPQLAAKMPDHELWVGFLRDPDGNLVGLMEEKR
jgi:catechol 2,3-dioxygenase-like lactoylglutathione lyase family enzyme